VSVSAKPLAATSSVISVSGRPCLHQALLGRRESLSPAQSRPTG
jgi:hypothetical protein